MHRALQPCCESEVQAAVHTTKKKESNIPTRNNNNNNSNGYNFNLVKEEMR